MEGETIAIVDSRPERVPTLGVNYVSELFPSFSNPPSPSEALCIQNRITGAFLEISQATLRSRGKCVTRLFLFALPSISLARPRPRQ